MIYSIVLISIITSIYTVLGGLRAVVVTETVQTLILLLGAVLVTALALLALPEHGISSFAEFKAALGDVPIKVLDVKPGQALKF